MQNNSKQKPLISVIIPVYRDWVRLQQCLSALAEQTFPQSSCEILIVNNDPGSDVPAWLHLAKNTTMLVESRKGSYAARNCGIAAARGKILAFTDSDCIPSPQWLQSAVDMLQADSGVYRVAGPVELFFSGTHKTLAEMYESVKAFNQKKNARKGTALTANVLVRSEVFAAVGGFNDALLSGGDIEWGKRAGRAGFAIGYEPGAVVFHPARRRLSELSAKARRVAAKDYRQFITWRPGTRYTTLCHAFFHEPGSFRRYLRKSANPVHAVLAYAVGWWLACVRVVETIRLQLGGEPRR